MAALQLPIRAKAVTTDVGAIWRAAMDRHEKDTSVKIASLTRVNDVDEMLAELHTMETEAKHQRHDGSKLDRLRSLLSKTLTPVQQLCDIVAPAASIPFPPSTAIFTAISYLIKTVNSVSGDYDKIAAFFEDLCSYLCRLKILERHISPSTELEVAIAEVLTSVLVLCGICAKYAKKKRIEKAWRNLVSGEDNELSKAYADFRKAVGQEQGAVVNSTLAIVDQLEKGSMGIKADVQKSLLVSERTELSTQALMASTEQLNQSFQNKMTTFERDDILAKLSLLNFHERQKDIFAEHHPGTGRWLLDTYQFQKWLADRQASVLWCPGIPGAGKTVMTSLVVNYVDEAVQGTGAAIAYIYCEYKNPETQSELQILASIARQLTEQMKIVPAVVQEFCNNKAAKRRHSTREELTSLVKSICLLLPKIYVFVDALDECSEANIDRLLSSIKQLEHVARFFITCRPSLDLHERFTNIARIDVHARISDIHSYLEHKIKESWKLSKFVVQDVHLKEDIIEHVSERSAGMFLLAYLQLGSLCKQTILKEIRTTMSKLPRKLFEYYGEAMERVEYQGDEETQLARRTISYIFCAQRPLKVIELRHALAVNAEDSGLDTTAFPEVDIILKVTVGLVRIDKRSQTIGLVHYTLQEFLEKHPENLLAYPDIEMAQASLTYLSFNVFGLGPCTSGAQLRRRLEEYRFLEYVSHHLGHHLRKDQVHVKVMHLLSTFLEDKEKLLSFVQILHLTSRRKPDWYDCYPRGFDALHVLAYWGLNEILARIVQEADFDSRDSYGATALQQAASNGHKSVVHFLLTKGADVNTRNEKGETPLLWAARNRHKAVVEVLLRSNAKVLTKDIEGWTALDWAAVGGDIDILRMLLKYGADITAEGGGRAKALYLAAWEGHELTVQILLDSGADINARDSEGSTALDWAVPAGNEKTVRLLLRNGADVRSRDDQGNAALHWATPYQTLVSLLLECGAEVDAKNDKRQTALCWAAQDGPVEVAELLLENEADINAQDVYGLTALHRAALRGRQTMVRLLLEKGADPNLKDKDQWTPLHVAALKQFEDVIQLLQNHVDHSKEILSWVNLQFKDNKNQAILEEIAEKKAEASTVLTGLRAAIQERQFGRSQLLLDRGADVDGKEVGGWTALIMSSSTGDLEAMQLLLDNGADVNLSGHDQRTPLHWASERGEVAAVNLLVERGANIEVRAFEWTAMLLAASKGHLGIVNILVRSGTDVSSEDYHGRTALHWVAKYGGNATVKLLAEKGANVNASDRWGKTALMWAIGNGRTRTVRVLLEIGANVNIKARHNVTPLHLAVFLGYQSIVRYLLERGADANVVASWCEADDIADKEFHAMGTIEKSLGRLLRDSPLEQLDVDKDGIEPRYGLTVRQLAARGNHTAVQCLLEPNTPYNCPFQC